MSLQGRRGWMWGLGGVVGLVLLTACEDRSTVSFSLDQELPPSFILQWGTFGADDGEFDQPFDIAVGPDGSVYVTDMQNHRVQRFTDQGAFVSGWTLPTSGPQPHAIAVGKNDVVYLRPWKSSSIWRFNSNGEDLGALGQGGGHGGISVDADGSIYVVRSGSVWKMAEDGTMQASWDVPVDADLYFHPHDIAVDQSGGTYVVGDEAAAVLGTDIIANSLWKFHRSGRVWWKLSFSKDLNLLGVAVDSKGNVFVTSATEGTVKKFSGLGVLLVEWSEVSPDHEPLDFPAGIVVDVEDNIYVADVFRNRVVKFSPSD